jgi:hypothetical protein
MAHCRQHLEHALVLEYEVAAGDTATAGEAVILDSDTTIDDADGATDLAIGIALDSGTPGQRVRVAMFGHAVVPVKAGTGTITRGSKAVLAADGFINAAAHNSDGSGNESTYGIFLASADTGDMVPLLLSGAANRGVT